MADDKKPVVGFFSFTSCQGCQFTILFLDQFAELFEKLDVRYFHLLKEKNKKTLFDIAFVEGAVSSKIEVEKLKKIRAKSKMLVSIGACACHGGIPAMRNFIENDELGKYVYSQQMLDDSIPASAIDKFVKVDYHMYGCPIMKDEFVSFVESYIADNLIKEFEGPVCNECPRRGKNCFLLEKKECLGAITNGGCKAICIKKDIPCIMCRGPLDKANFPGEVALFKSWGLSEEDIFAKLSKFGEDKIKEIFPKGK